TGVLFGLAPVWQVSRSGIAEGMRAGGRGASGVQSHLLDGLAMVEIAIAVLVGTGAGLFLQTLSCLTEGDPGSHAEHVLTAHVLLPLTRYPTQERALNFYESVQRELEALPGVRSASLGGSLPLAGWDIGQGFKVLGAPPLPPDKIEAVHYQIVGARYFETLGIPLLAGRAFDDPDRPGAQGGAIVNPEFARRFLQDRPKIGAPITGHATDPPGPEFVTLGMVVHA